MEIDFDSMISDRIKSYINDPKLLEICLYASRGGKRIRPRIAKSIYYSLTNLEDNLVDDIAVSIELIHCASLVLDDMMDEDLIRRDQPSVYAKYGNTLAQLASTQLMSIAFILLTRCLKAVGSKPETNKDNLMEILSCLTNNLFELNLGQYRDTIKVSETKSKIEIEDLIQNKTSSLFELCFILPWILANYNRESRFIDEGITELKFLARDFGLIFQIKDDFEDIDQDLAKGSTVNYCISQGKEEAFNRFNQSVEDFKNRAEHLKILSFELLNILSILQSTVTSLYTGV